MIPSGMVVKAFKKCGVSNVMDGTDDMTLLDVERNKEASDSNEEQG